MRHVRGQAFTEFLALCLALVPLFLLVPMIARYQDIVFSTQVASRYAAFDAINRNPEQASWKPEAELRNEVTRRFLSNSETPIKTGDVSGNFDAHRNPFWRDVAGHPLIRNVDTDVAATFGIGRKTSRDSAAFENASDGKPFNVVIPFGDIMGLPSRGIYTAGVQVAPAKLPTGLMFIRPFDVIDLKIHSHTSLLLNGWAARNPSQVSSRIDKELVFPGRVLRNPLIGEAVRMMELEHVRSPAVAELPLWEDVVPNDRLRANNH